MRCVESKSNIRVLTSLLLGLIILLALGCGGQEENPPSAVASSNTTTDVAKGSTDGDLFVDVAASTGLDFVHFNGMSGELYLSEITCGGGALFDYDNDGDLDVYLLQGQMLGPGKTLDDATFPPQHPTPLTDRLYRNDLVVQADGRRELRFTDVTLESGLVSADYGCGVASGDYDNDGWTDLYLTRLGKNQLLRNQGDGTFRDATMEAAVADDRSGIPAAFFDFDRDGWLDLFLANNVNFLYDNPPPCKDLAGAPDYCGPGSYPFEEDRLFHNRGGRFEDVTEEAGLSGIINPALGVVTADFNGDDWLDIFVANDGQPNHLWINQSDGTFLDEALLSGSAVNAGGQAEASMGVDAGDFDGDGDLDLFMTHLVKETNTLYVNDGQGMFEDRTVETGLGAASQRYTSFGTGWFDYDLDGWLDLLIVSGAVTRQPEQVRQGDPFPLHQPNQLFHNLGNGRFAEVTASAGQAFELSDVSRGAAFGDLDNDGDSDVLVINNNGPVRLLLNQNEDGHWLGLRLTTGESRRDSLGAQAAVIREGQPPMWRRVRVEGSYCSANDPRVLFGLGEVPSVDRILVHWPDGTEEAWSGLAIDQYHTLHQGEGQEVP